MLPYILKEILLILQIQSICEVTFDIYIYIYDGYLGVSSFNMPYYIFGARLKEILLSCKKKKYIYIYITLPKKKKKNHQT